MSLLRDVKSISTSQIELRGKLCQQMCILRNLRWIVHAFVLIRVNKCRNISRFYDISTFFLSFCLVVSANLTLDSIKTRILWLYGKFRHNMIISYSFLLLFTILLTLNMFFSSWTETRLKKILVSCKSSTYSRQHATTHVRV